MQERRFLPSSAAPIAFTRRMRGFAIDSLVTVGLFAACAAAFAQAPERIAQSVNLARLQVLADHHPLWANAHDDAGVAPADLQLNQLELVLKRSPEQERAFQQLLADQQNPASPNFHHWLTPQQVGERYGLSDHDLAALRAWLESQGLNVNWVAPGRDFIGFGGSTADVARAFHTQMHYYNVAGKRRLSVASDPMIPAALAPAIAAVRGLYDIQDRPAHLVSQEQSTEFSEGGNRFLAPGDFATIYDLPANLSGAGVTIGIVGWSFVDFTDLDHFRQFTGSSFADPSEVVPAAFGGVNPGTPYTAPQSCSNCMSGQSEATLDVTRAGSVAQDANLLLVASSPSGANDGIGAAAQYLIQTTPVPAQIVNISFSDCESDAGPSGVSYWDHLFEQAAAEGISVFVSSGDSGAAGCDVSFATPPASPGAISPNYLCASSYATCVGGTDFNDATNADEYWSGANGSRLGSALSYIPEGAWNEPLTPSSTTQAAASGGGVSNYIAIPSWQKGTVGVPAANAGRYTPDLAFSASCREAYFGCLAAAGGSCVEDASGNYTFVTFCGTSTAAPGMAGIAALLDQAMGGQAQGDLNPRFYAMQSATPSVFHDITLASSGVSGCSLTVPSLCNNSMAAPGGLNGGQAGYLVGTGYDEVTGLGSLDVRAWIEGFSASQPATSNPQNPSFNVTGTPVTVISGASSGNTSTITVTPLAGFTGTVILAANITSKPAGAQNLPALSFGRAESVTLSSANPATATLTVSTTPQNEVSAPASRAPLFGLQTEAGSALACILLLWVPGWRRWRNLTAAMVLLVTLAMATTGCAASLHNAVAGVETATGTTAGSYTITVTATSGTTVMTTPVILIVQ